MNTDNKIIPKYFYLFGEKIKISKLKELDKGGSFGEAPATSNILKLAKTVKKKLISEEQMESTYCHELVHTILDVLGHEELSNNEAFVDSFGKALHQILKTSVY